MTRLRAGYSEEFVVECPGCDETRVVCGENSIDGYGAEFTVTGFDVDVTPVGDGDE